MFAFRVREGASDRTRKIPFGCVPDGKAGALRAKPRMIFQSARAIAVATAIPYSKERKPKHVILGHYLPDYRYHCRHPRIWWRGGNGSWDREDSLLRFPSPVCHLAANGPPVATGIAVIIADNPRRRVWVFPKGGTRARRLHLA